MPGHVKMTWSERTLNLAALDLLGEPLHQLGNLLELGMNRKRTAVGLERGLVVTELLHDGAEPGERSKVPRLARQHLMDVRNRALVILVVEVDRRTPVPGLDEIRLEIDDRVEELERDVELLLFHRGLDAPHQQIAGIATGSQPERPDPVLDVFGAFLGRRDLGRLDQLRFRVRTDLRFRGRDLRLGRRIDLRSVAVSVTLRRRDLRCLSTWTLSARGLSRRAHGRHGCEQGGDDESVESFDHGASLTLHQGVAKAVVRSKWRENTRRCEA